MVRRLPLLAILAVLVWPAAGAAQTPLTLADAIAAALERNPGVQAARAQADRASADASAAHGARWPRLTATESWHRSDQPVFVFGSLLSARRFAAADFAVSRLNSPGATNLFTTRLAVDQVVFDGGRTSGRIAAASAQHDAARADADAASAAVVLAVTRTYGQVLSLQAAASATDAAVAAATEDLARAGHRRDAGTVTEADVLGMSVHLADMSQRRLQIGADLASARATLNRLMGAPIEHGFDVVAEIVAPPTAVDLMALYTEAEAARPDLRRADALVRVADADARQAQSVWRPQISAEAGFEWNGTRPGDRAPAWILGAEARWSLSLSGADAARSRAAAAGRTVAMASRDGLRAAVHVEVFSAVRQLEAATARVQVGATARADARERARVVRNRYDAGLASMTDVLAAAAATLDAEARHVAAMVDALVVNADLQRALGRVPRK